MNESTRLKIEEAFALFEVADFFSLARAYSNEDQRLMKSDAWNDGDPSLLTNRLKTMLEAIDPAELSAKDVMWHQEILWFWYHHAMSHANVRKGDIELAKAYAVKALELQGEDHPNKITRLYWFLLHQQLDEARVWALGIDVDRDTAEWLIVDYEQNRFFKPSPA